METVTIASTSFDTYATIVQADDYLLASIDFAAWDANEDDAKSRFLVSATRLLDRQSWQSDYNTQAERESITDIVNASILLANEFSNGNTALLGFGASEAEVKRLKAGSVETENFRSFNSKSFTGSKTTDFPDAILAMLKPYLKNQSFDAFAASFGVSGVGIASADYGLTA